MSIKRIVKKVDFSDDSYHCALVSNPANGQEDVTIMKSKGGNVAGDKDKVDIKKAEEVRITTSMATFLEKFFRMWHEDANELSEMLGYEPQEWFFDMVGDDTTVEILKSADDTTTVSKEVYENLKKARPVFNKLKNRYEKEIEKQKENEMGDEDVKKRIEELEKARKEYEAEVEKYKKEAQTEKEKREKLEKEQIKKEKENYKTLFKGYSFVDESKLDDIVDVAIKCKGVEGFDCILETLEKANDSLKASLEDEKGSDEKKNVEKGQNGETPDKVSELIKKRYSKE